MNRLQLIQMSLLVLACLPGYGCSRGGSPENQRTSVQQAGLAAESRRLAVVTPAYLSLEQDTTRPQGSHDSLVVIAKDGAGAAFIERVGSQYRVVHNGQSGVSYQLVGDLTISNDGKRVAYVAHGNDSTKRIVADGKEGPSFAEIGMPKFTPDGKHLLYTATQGGGERLVVDHVVRQEYNVSPDLLLSPDSKYLGFAALSLQDKHPLFVITDFSLQDKKVFEACGDWVTASEDRSRIAFVCSDKGARSIKIVDFQSKSVISTLKTPATGTIVRRKFSPDNRSFVYTTMTDELERFLYFNGRVEKVPDGEEIMSDPLVLSNPERVGVIIGTASKVTFHTAFHKSTHKEKDYGYISDFTATQDGRHHAYVAINPGGEERMRVVVDGYEGPLFDKIVSPLFSPDGRFLVYRARQAGKRFLVLSDLKGAVIRQHKEYAMVFQPAFVNKGTAVAYGVLDGNELWWKVEKL